MTVGRSEATPYKQECLRELAKDHLNKFIDIYNKHDWIRSPYWIFDLTSGDMELVEETSPRIFLELVKSKECLGKYIPINIILAEKDKSTFNKLEKNINTWLTNLSSQQRERIEPNIYLYNSDFTEQKLWVQKERKWNYGFLYFDPNGIGGHKELEFLAEFSKKWNAVDLLINISLTTLKRCYRSNHPRHQYFNKNLQEILQTFNKKYWWIRPPPENLNKKFHWIMLFGTNMQNYHIRSLNNFFGFNSFLGMQLLDFYNHFIQY